MVTAGVHSGPVALNKAKVAEQGAPGPADQQAVNLFVLDTVRPRSHADRQYPIRCLGKQVPDSLSNQIPLWVLLSAISSKMTKKKKWQNLKNVIKEAHDQKPTITHDNNGKHKQFSASQLKANVLV